MQIKIHRGPSCKSIGVVVRRSFRSFASELEQVAEVNSASYTQRDRKWVVAYGLWGWVSLNQTASITDLTYTKSHQYLPTTMRKVHSRTRGCWHMPFYRPTHFASLPLSHRRRRRGQGARTSLKFGKNFLGKLLCKIRVFWGQKSCKIREFCKIFRQT